MNHNKSKKHRKIWQSKLILRKIYQQWYKDIITDLSSVKGKTIELGAGSGNFKSFYPQAIATDIVSLPWLDMTFDALKMPFKRHSVANLVIIDLLHHLEDPIKFLTEAKRVLKPRGRLIMLEPFPSLISLIIYRLTHPEPFIFDRDYFKQATIIKKNNKTIQKKSKDPWEANQAIPYLLFFKQKKDFLKKFGNDFKIIKRQRLATLAYPLSGGFERKPLLPAKIFPYLMKIEDKLTFLRPLLAFRCYIVLEKK
ncbi:MAG: class I SAM-dependent methyltransferase [Candidatus Woesebacteria bacterium]|jgi:SAM-dependent methyltransferase